ncbi:unnamed protein product [Tilletia laevis]|uniref:Uncharacterized protein n=2 Tax=Tilletia TaxID=13289 RepID=A0A177U520_9BASI|nr:hypothetical protein CF336_g6607 [Tilletia laevis]KAE8252695.1 hypothetical protein A4X03_0g6096 [Tilletia caries]KAE8191809.1 hypothetical protein CF335_g5988 [Tilletia laevis]CAD6885766.1 unnamed protein product [Tilletia caries]CAD6903172.1 unnamed protein product [Tilletia laevis]
MSASARPHPISRGSSSNGGSGGGSGSGSGGGSGSGSGSGQRPGPGAAKTSHHPPAPTLRSGIQTRSNARHEAQVSADREADTRPRLDPQQVAGPSKQPEARPPPAASTSKSSKSLTVQLNCEKKGWHILGRQSYELTIAEVVNIYGPPTCVEDISLYYRANQKGKFCRIAPSAWSALPPNAPIYAKGPATTKKGKRKSAKAKGSKLTKKQRRELVLAAQSKEATIIKDVLKPPGQKGKGKATKSAHAPEPHGDSRGAQSSLPPSVPKAPKVKFTGSNTEPLGQKTASTMTADSSRAADSPVGPVDRSTQMELVSDRVTSKKRALDAEDGPYPRRASESTNCPWSKGAAVRTWWEQVRMYKSPDQVRHALASVEDHMRAVKSSKCVTPDCFCHGQALQILLRAKAWLQQVQPLFQQSRNFTMAYYPEELAKQKAQSHNLRLHSASQPPALPVSGQAGQNSTWQQSERHLMNKRSRFGSLPTPSTAIAPSDKELPLAEAPLALPVVPPVVLPVVTPVMPPVAQQSTSGSSVRSTNPPPPSSSSSRPHSSSSRPHSSSSRPHSSSSRTRRSTVGPDVASENRPRPREVHKKERDEDDDSDFELVAVFPPRPLGQQSDPGAASGSRDRDGRDNDSERDELVSDDNASDRDVSMNTNQTAASDTGNETADTDRSWTFEMPRRSSHKHWTAKEHTIFMDKLRAETESLDHHLAPAERQTFFDRFERKYGRMLNQRTSPALLSRLTTVKNAARLQNKSLPQQLEYLFPARSKTHGP